MKTIYDFKKGDAIVRTIPAKEYSPARMGIFGMDGGVRDRSYIGQKMIFVGIANGMIYLQRTTEFELKIFGDKLVDLSLDIWDEGWDYFIDPLTLIEGNESIFDKSTLEQKIKDAIANEDYELAEKLKHKLADKPSEREQN